MIVTLEGIAAIDLFLAGFILGTLLVHLVTGWWH
jgi:hypothetical protein